MSDTATSATDQAQEQEAVTTDDADPAPGAIPGEEALGDPGKKAIDAMKAEVKAAKAEARRVRTELENIQRESMSEQERLVAEAEARGESTATAKLAGRLVDAEIKAAASGRTVDVEALLEGLDRTRFLTDDGEPDGSAIQAWVDRLAPKPDPTTQTVDLGQGARSTGDLALNGDPLLNTLKDKLGIG